MTVAIAGLLAEGIVSRMARAVRAWMRMGASLMS